MLTTFYLVLLLLITKTQNSGSNNVTKPKKRRFSAMPERRIEAEKPHQMALFSEWEGEAEKPARGWQRYQMSPKRYQTRYQIRGSVTKQKVTRYY